MFTGLIEESIRVLAVESRPESGARLVIEYPEIEWDARYGESIAINGCCLTASPHEQPSGIAFDILDETLRVTNFTSLQVGSLVNLERALEARERWGGHFVQGHVDCAARVIAFERKSGDYRLEIELPCPFARYLITKGSIAVNGISLTVAEILSGSFVVWIIPQTFKETNLRELQAGDLVNLEFDLLAKYVERLLQK